MVESHGHGPWSAHAELALRILIASATSLNGAVGLRAHFPGLVPLLREHTSAALSLSHRHDAPHPKERPLGLDQTTCSMLYLLGLLTDVGGPRERWSNPEEALPPPIVDEGTVDRVLRAYRTPAAAEPLSSPASHLRTSVEALRESLSRPGASPVAIAAATAAALYETSRGKPLDLRQAAPVLEACRQGVVRGLARYADHSAAHPSPQSTAVREMGSAMVRDYARKLGLDLGEMGTPDSALRGNVEEGGSVLDWALVGLLLLDGGTLPVPVPSCATSQVRGSHGGSIIMPCLTNGPLLSRCDVKVGMVDALSDVAVSILRARLPEAVGALELCGCSPCNWVSRWLRQAFVKVLNIEEVIVTLTLVAHGGPAYWVREGIRPAFVVFVIWSGLLAGECWQNRLHLQMYIFHTVYLMYIR
jgi:hypothetical protein